MRLALMHLHPGREPTPNPELQANKAVAHVIPCRNEAQIGKRTLGKVDPSYMLGFDGAGWDGAGLSNLESLKLRRLSEIEGGLLCLALRRVPVFLCLQRWVLHLKAHVWASELGSGELVRLHHAESVCLLLC